MSGVNDTFDHFVGKLGQIAGKDMLLSKTCYFFETLWYTNPISKLLWLQFVVRSGRIAGREIIDLIVSILLHPGTRGRERCQ